MSRTIVIGDVHGCLDELDALLAACDLSPRDAVVHVGDLVAKGPDSKGVVRRMRELGARGVRGNHEEHVLRILDAKARKEKLARFSEDHANVARALSDGDVEYIRALPYYLELHEEQILIVHAGLVPGLPLRAQSPETMTTLRSFLPDGTPSKRLTAGIPWASRWPGPYHVLFGHDAVRGLQRHAHATGLDTGCVYGNRLTAMVLPERELVSIGANETWRAARGAVRVEAGRAEAIGYEDVVPVRLAPDKKGRPREAIVLRDESGTLRAYMNICKHLPIPLDGGSRRFWDPTGRFLDCGTHGARYRREDGYCFEGPCEGASLDSIGICEEDGVVYVIDEPQKK